MKALLVKFQLILILVLGIKFVNGQQIILKSDTIAITSDSLYLTVPGTYQGILTWQQSIDSVEWHSLESTTGDSLFVEIFFDSYYRAKIKEGTCNDVYTDIVKITAYDSVISSFNDSIVEYAYPDSTGTVVDVQFGIDTVKCRLVNGEYIFQGDIILDESQISEFPGLKGAGVSFNDVNKAWPDNKVFYTIKTKVYEGKIQDAIDYWDKNTTLNFININDEYNINHIEFVRSKIFEGNSSNLGMIGGTQQIRINILEENIFDNIFSNESEIFGIALHEIGHAVGLLHEHSRSDRDTFIIVNEENIDISIREGKDFDIYKWSLNVPLYEFDFQSIMLYPSYANSINNEPTITKKDGTVFATQRSYLSKYDILTVKMLYPVIPDIVTLKPSNITSSSMTCGGEVLDNGGREITDLGLCWSTYQFFTTDDNYVSVKQSTNKFSKSVNNLNPNTKYYIKAYATNEIGTAYGHVAEFTTKVALPEVTTGSVSEITFHSATIVGNFTSDGGATITARGVVWSTAQNPTLENKLGITINGIGTGSFISSLTGLTANTPYYVRAYATNSQGTAYGSQVAFTTGQTITQPSVTTTSITNITQTTATSGGNITADGGATVTARGVCWGTSTNPTTANSKTSDGNGTGSFTSNLTGLAANTKYYVRAYATNNQGTAYGNEVTFTSAPLVDTENYFMVGSEKHTLNLGYNVWLSELDCGSFDVFAHCLYLTSNVEIKKYGDSDFGQNLLPSGIGKLLIFNMYSKNSELIPGKYIFVDDVDCVGKVTDGDMTFTMSSTDKFVASSGGPIDPTCYTTNVNLDIDWNTVDTSNPSNDVLEKFTNYRNSITLIKDGSVTIEKSGEIYTITYDCIDNNGTKITGKYKGVLNFVEFGI